MKLNEYEALMSAAADKLVAAQNKERDMLNAVSDLVEMIDKAGLLNLSNGVQLGQTSWFVKTSDCLERVRALIAAASKGEAQ